MVRSPAFGSTTHDLNRAIRTRFRFGFAPETLNLALYRKSPDHYAKGTPSAIPTRGIGLRPLVRTWFQVLFTPLKGVLFTFPSRY